MPDFDQALGDFIRAAKAERQAIEDQRVANYEAGNTFLRQVAQEALRVVTRGINAAGGTGTIDGYTLGDTHLLRGFHFRVACSPFDTTHYVIEARGGNVYWKWRRGVHSIDDELIGAIDRLSQDDLVEWIDRKVKEDLQAQVDAHRRVLDD